jgi:hypothetical protein
MQTVLCTCIVCSSSFEMSERIFEQRMIDDTDFCPRCFKEIMNTVYDSDTDHYLGSIIV